MHIPKKYQTQFLQYPHLEEDILDIYPKTR
nr:MAG TPA: hypothetical protein [Caudoviricetes sp.]